MNIFAQTKELVNKEKFYTAKILNNLMVIERDKLFCDLKYSSLHKYIMKELNYSEAEATLRVNAVRLMLKSSSACKKIYEGKMSLTNAAEANKVLHKSKDKTLIEKVVAKASEESTREFKKFVDTEFKKERKEVLILNELMLTQFDRLRKKYGDLSSYELIQIMLERELRAPAPVARQRVRACTPKNSRSIPKSVKLEVYTGKCANCGSRHSLEYDHKRKFSHGGTNHAQNIQMLCRQCNQRKEIKARQSSFFA